MVLCLFLWVVFNAISSSGIALKRRLLNHLTFVDGFSLLSDSTFSPLSPLLLSLESPCLSAPFSLTHDHHRGLIQSITSQDEAHTHDHKKKVDDVYLHSPLPI